MSSDIQPNKCFRSHNNRTVVLHFIQHNLLIRSHGTQLLLHNQKELNLADICSGSRWSFYMYRSSPEAKLACLINELL